jgi:lipoprotein-anchoring transpeptidase ErfK/SrfK
MSKPVPGGWHWFSPTDLHFRPTHFWPSGEQVEAVLNLAGWHLGQGVWGQGVDRSAFVIGDAHVSVVNLATHEMTVSNNGHVIYVWPISAGAPQWPTQDGIHIVLDRTSKVQMISSTVGIPVNSPNGYNETVYWDTQISYSGEYVHAAPWSISDQGIANVSHGCVNVSPARAEAFFHFSRVGDVVDVVDGARPPLITDGGVEDWSFPASQVAWTPAKVAHLATTVTLLPTTTEPAPPGAPTTVAPLPTLPPTGPAITLPVPSTYPPYTPPATTVYVPPPTTIASTTSTGTTTSTTKPTPTTAVTTP